MADAKNTVLFPYETLKKLSMDAFQKFGFSEKEADIIQDVLLTSDLFGIQSHGMQRMVRYHKGITNGLIKIDAKPEIVKETPISAVIDGHDGMGQLLGHKAMEMAIEKAKKSGVGIVSVRNSNHYGIAGYYAKMASDQGLIGFSCTNSEAIMVPTYARKAMLGSNPIAWTVPADPVDFFFDCSTTVVTRGKLEMYNKMGKATPDGWAVNKDGVPSTDAAEVLGNISRHEGGGILPLGGATEVLGGHKGYSRSCPPGTPPCRRRRSPRGGPPLPRPHKASAGWSRARRRRGRTPPPSGSGAGGSSPARTGEPRCRACRPESAPQCAWAPPGTSR